VIETSYEMGKNISMVKGTTEGESIIMTGET
jgi:hypothetical protein